MRTPTFLLLLAFAACGTQPEAEKQEKSTAATLVSASEQEAKGPKIRNGIELQSNGVSVEQAFLTYEDGSLVREDNITNVNKKLLLNLVVSGWEGRDGKVQLEASEQLTTSEGEVLLDEPNLFSKSGISQLSIQDARYLRLNIVITGVNELADHYQVTFKVWNLYTQQFIYGTYRFFIGRVRTGSILRSSISSRDGRSVYQYKPTTAYMRDFFIPLESGAIYHIFNRGNNGDRLFYAPRNYEYFLNQLQNRLSPYLNFYCYCLLPNHFHLLVRVKQVAEFPIVFDKAGSPQATPANLSEQFRRFFLGYAAAIKKQEGRTGSLFEKNFKRIRIPDADYLRYTVNYIHQNPSKHRVVPDFRTYCYSSYRACLSGADSWLCCKEVLSWFDGSEGFIRYHDQHEVMRSAS